MKYIIPVLFLSCILGACSESLDEINIDPNRVTEIDDAYLFSSAVKNTFGSVQNERKLQLYFGSQYSHFYVVRNNSGRPHDKYLDYLFTDDYNVAMKGSFTNAIKYSNKVVSMTSEKGTNNKLRNAMAKVVSICNYTRITDLYGNIPYTEGGWGDIGVLSPKYDEQEYIYKNMMNTLKECIEIIKNGDPLDGYEDFDPLFDNHLENWTKFANSMRLRLAIRARFAAPEYSERVIAECLQDDLIENNDENARLFSLNDAYHYNQWSETWKVMPWKMSKYLVDWLSNSHDPRLTFWVAPNINGEYKGIENGMADDLFVTIKWEEISDPAPKLYAGDMPVHFLTAAEVSFNKAESELIINGSDANNYYQDGIRQTMSLWNIPLDSIDRFINEEPEGTLFGDTENMLRQIGTQKWLSLITNFTEAYSEIRRLDYPVIPKRTDSWLEKGDTDGYLPKRFLYPLEEISLNPEHVNEAIAQQGPNEITTRVWWDVH